MTDSTEAPPADKASPEPKKKPKKKRAEAPPAPQAEPKAASPEEPKKRRKIAVLGSAVSSVALAPFRDLSWEIWGCSPANRELPRVDIWFELHNPEVKKREGLTEWLQWLAKQPIVYMQRGPSPEFPLAREYPLEAMVQEHGRYWWTSQIAYMLAAAIEQEPEAIGIYGVDMAANSEYNQQRLACQYFIMEAVRRGIKVVIPPESDLIEPPPMYGYCESSRQYRKYMARTEELRQRIQNCVNTRVKADQEERHLIGALDDLEYQMAHWANRPDFVA